MKLVNPGKIIATMAVVEEWVWVCPTTGCDTGKGAPFKPVNVSEATARALLKQHIASAHITTTATSDVTRQARKAAERARQRAAKYIA